MAHRKLKLGDMSTNALQQISANIPATRATLVNLVLNTWQNDLNTKIGFSESNFSDLGIIEPASLIPLYNLLAFMEKGE